jgi:hypothetical protein
MRTLKQVVGGLALGVIGCAVVVALLMVALWARDVELDRKHVVLVKSETPVFAGEGDESCGGTQLTTVQAGANLHVQRIRYWKNCATVNIVLPDSREGYIVLGDGEVLVKPHLP